MSKSSSTNVTVKTRYICLEDNSQSLELEIHSDGCINNIIMPRSEVFNISDTLYNYGAVITTAKDFKSEMIKQEKYAPVKFIHSSVGWDEYNGKRIFKSYCAVGFKSTYNGKFDIKPKGSFEEWKKIIVKYALPQIALQLSVILGLAAVTIGFLQNEIENTVLVHLFGKSSSGKTTAILLALSTSGNPNPIAKNTFFCDWGDTQNYLMSVLSENHGFPVAFDELSKANQSRNLTEFVYNVTNSKSKGRLDSQAKMKEVSTSSCLVLSSGENSLLANHCNRNAGLLVRVLEISPDEITASAEQAEAIKEGVINNYGFANNILAEYYLQNSESVIEVFGKYRNIFKRDIPIKNELVDRLIKKIAVIMTTAYFSKKALDIPFDTKAIKNMLIEAVIQQNENNPFEQSKQFVDYILTDLSTNPNKYVTLKRNEPIADIFGSNIRGFIREIKPIKIKDEICSFELIFPKSIFEELVLKWGFTNVLKELKSLDEKGYIKKEGKHYSIRRKIAGNLIPVYVLTLPSSMRSD